MYLYLSEFLGFRGSIEDVYERKLREVDVFNSDPNTYYLINDVSPRLKGMEKLCVCGDHAVCGDDIGTIDEVVMHMFLIL